MAVVQYTNEYADLKEVIMYCPTPQEIAQSDIRTAMYVDTPDPQKVIDEVKRVAAWLENFGIIVTLLKGDGYETHCPNMIFMRDSALAFQDKLVLARMKHPVRQDETRIFKRLLGKARPELMESLVSLPHSARMEGADVFVLGGNEIAAYTGNRTNAAAATALQNRFADADIRQIAAQIFNVPQHLLGGMHILDHDLAIRRTELCQNDVSSFDYIDIREDDEVTNGFAMNILTLGPKEVLMPAGNPKTKQRLMDSGVICHEIAVNEVHKMGGGLACMILPIRRNYA